ncbi:hypothetical protein, partial [Shewanella litorisediminis]
KTALQVSAGVQLGALYFVQSCSLAKLCTKWNPALGANQTWMNTKSMVFLLRAASLREQVEAEVMPSHTKHASTAVIHQLAEMYGRLTRSGYLSIVCEPRSERSRMVSHC